MSLLSGVKLLKTSNCAGTITTATPTILFEDSGITSAALMAGFTKNDRSFSAQHAITVKTTKTNAGLVRFNVNDRVTISYPDAGGDAASCDVTVGTTLVVPQKIVLADEDLRTIICGLFLDTMTAEKCPIRNNATNALNVWNSISDNFENLLLGAA
jgi:hypothetical protein